MRTQIQDRILTRCHPERMHFDQQFLVKYEDGLVKRDAMLAGFDPIHSL